MGKILVVAMVLLPCVALADTRCWITEFRDHYEAVCVGDEMFVPVPAATALPGRMAATGQSAETSGSVVPPRTEAAVSAAPSGELFISAKKPASARTAETSETPARTTTVTPTPRIATTTVGKPPVPTTIGLHRPSQSVRDAARASRARLTMEERQNDPENSAI